ncbi:metallophosphoesterase [Synechococcus sp. CBW1107]|uniref:metallophosphoesterase n=1 Tax=Synechococcus sp. CBW1107 TaxID=2789857 RepID=UPI002AD2E9DE|nr:metallophosphoesterase [Synechococcus sp. CBW1107]CAK6698648.1 Bis(5'-nucleosyl)-tetraphosphatase, symmetrical [Synechococcus sp. CBW1107]
MTPFSRPPRHWVIGDVHGCADALQRLIGALPPDDRLVFCGDVINRGPQIERTMRMVWQLVLSGRAVWLRGNHEQALLEALDQGHWFGQQALAGCDTYRQLGDGLCRLWRDRLASLPLVYWGQGWAATHAGFDPVDWTPDLRIRLPFWQAYDGRFGEVVVGHTPGPELRRLNGIVMIDTAACYGGELTAYCPETGSHRAVPGLRSGLDLCPLPPSRPCPEALAGGRA